MTDKTPAYPQPGRYDVLRCFEERAAKRLTAYSTAMEVATALGRPLDEIQPIIAEARAAGELEEDPRYRGHFALSRGGQAALDASAFL